MDSSALPFSLQPFFPWTLEWWENPEIMGYYRIELGLGSSAFALRVLTNA